MEKGGSVFYRAVRLRVGILMTRRLLIGTVSIRANDGVERTSPTKAAIFGCLQMGSRPSGSRWVGNSIVRLPAAKS